MSDERDDTRAYGPGQPVVYPRDQRGAHPAQESGQPSPSRAAQERGPNLYAPGSLALYEAACDERDRLRADVTRLHDEGRQLQWIHRQLQRDHADLQRRHRSLGEINTRLMADLARTGEARDKALDGLRNVDPEATVSREPAWQREVVRVHTAVQKPWLAWSRADRLHLLLGLVARVGSLAAHQTAVAQGVDFGGALVQPSRDIADVRVMLHLLARALHVDEDVAVTARLPHIYSTFGVDAPRGRP